MLNYIQNHSKGYDKDTGNRKSLNKHKYNAWMHELQMVYTMCDVHAKAMLCN
jgi:hypothetical protein